MQSTTAPAPATSSSRSAVVVIVAAAVVAIAIVVIDAVDAAVAPAVCMPAVLRLNAPVIEHRFDRAAAYLGIEGGFHGFQAFVQEFNDSFGIPRKLSDMGVSADRIDDLVAMALEDPSCGGNPVTLTTENLRKLFEATI